MLKIRKLNTKEYLLKQFTQMEIKVVLLLKLHFFFLLRFMKRKTKIQTSQQVIAFQFAFGKKDSSPNLQEEQFYKFLCKLTEICKKYLEEEYGPDLASSLSEPLYYKQVEFTDKKGKKKNKRDTSAAPVLYAKLIYSEKAKKILSLFRTKGKQKVNPFNYLNQYCHVKMALTIEGIFISKTVTPLQIKVHECYIKELKPRESLLTIEEESEASEASEESEASEAVREELKVSESEESDTEQIIEDKEVTE